MPAQGVSTQPGAYPAHAGCPAFTRAMVRVSDGAQLGVQVAATLTAKPQGSCGRAAPPARASWQPHISAELLSILLSPRASPPR